MKKNNSGLTQFNSIRLVRNLFGADLLNRVLTGDPKFAGNRKDAFMLPPGLSVADEVARSARIALGSYRLLCGQEREEKANLAFVETIVSEAFGYGYTPCPPAGIAPDLPADLQGMLPGMAPQTQMPAEDLYPITATLTANHAGNDVPLVPLLVVPPDKDLDKVHPFSDGKRRTPFNLMQEFLDRSGRFLWAIVTNGKDWRLLRDSTTVALSSYLDIDLDAVLEARDLEAFAGIYRVLHVSRAVCENAQGPSSCLWEKWRQELEQGGERVREGLSRNVRQALRELGSGFLQHPANGDLVEAVKSGKFSAADFYNELLRLAYRFIFLFVMEERHLLHAHDKGNAAGREAYRKGYSMARLVRASLSVPKGGKRYDDLWRAVQIVFSALGNDGGEPRLALPALGGIFDSEQCPHLDKFALPNKAFLSAMRLLRWSSRSDTAQLLPIDYRNMDSEELGSVYEELLELTPLVNIQEKRFDFTFDSLRRGRRNAVNGNKRKTTGSYYTPACLVELMVNSALEPLIQKISGKWQEQVPFDKIRQELLSLRILDPACGSGHFLLSAARHLARAVAEATNAEEPEKEIPQAMHDVIANCIYGVDLNPMAVELVRMNLWLEGYMPNRPLSFLDDHLVCGNSLLGITSWDMTSGGIPNNPKAKPTECDSKDVFSAFKRNNNAEQKELTNRPKHLRGYHTIVDGALSMDEHSPSDVRHKTEIYATLTSKRQREPMALSADALIGSFLMPKTDLERIPTTKHVLDAAAGIIDCQNSPAIKEAFEVCRKHKVLHWPLVFPEVMEAGGFDCILCNPPWEKNKLAEKEWFARRYPAIANTSKKATRSSYIRYLSQGKLGSFLLGETGDDVQPNLAELSLYSDYLVARHLAAATSGFYCCPNLRYPLTGQGDMNLYALFAETCLALLSKTGQAGLLVPTGLATDKNTSAFFRDLVQKHKLQSLFDFENKYLFPSVHRSYKFSALTIAPSASVTTSFFLTDPAELQDENRKLTFTEADFRAVNPNTETSPVPRSKKDAELLTKVYSRIPVFIKEMGNVNPWGISFSTLFHMSNDSKFFLDTAGQNTLPLFEGKMVHLYDHRWASPEKGKKGKGSDDEAGEEDEGNEDEGQLASLEQKKDIHFSPSPRYWVEASNVVKKLPGECKVVPKWFLCYRTITNATNERTWIPAIIPFSGVGNSLTLLFPARENQKKVCCLYANMASLVVDFIVRCKLGGTNMNQHYVEQFPIITPAAYTDEAVEYITERVVKLCYTSESMRPFAEDMGYEGDPIVYDDAERAVRRAELDAVYAKLYGLSKEELAYILDPATFYMEKCPTVTFPGLRNNEMKAYGEYRTQRLVLEAFDRVPDFSIKEP